MAGQDLPPFYQRADNFFPVPIAHLILEKMQAVAAALGFLLKDTNPALQDGIWEEVHLAEAICSAGMGLEWISAQHIIAIKRLSNAIHLLDNALEKQAIDIADNICISAILI
ncbi:hypothetical protein ACJX0J_037230, partial [Zea mays]